MAEGLSELPALSEPICKKILPIKAVHKKLSFPEVPFNGLDYKPMVKTPTFTVKSSTDFKSWKKGSRLEEVDKEYQWGQSMAVRFKLKSTEQKFFIIQVDEELEFNS
jgi:hypothetical protein